MRSPEPACNSNAREWSPSDEDCVHGHSQNAESGYYDKVVKNQVIFDEEFGLFTERHRSNTTKQALALDVVDRCRRVPSNCTLSILNFIPILKWLPKYNCRENLVCDIIGGLTVGIMNIPQGMAYASLAGLNPVNGLYTSFFPALIYMIFGTSRHNSLGVFAVVSLMVGSTNIRLTKQLNNITSAFVDSSNSTASIISDDNSIGGVAALQTVTSIEIVSALTLCVGLIQIAMAILRLDFLTAYMSEQVMRGFTTGAAVHVLIAQLNKIFGIPLPRYDGFARLFYMLHDLIKQLPNANIATTITSFTTIIVLFMCKNHIAPRLQKFTKIPMPFELFAIIIGTSVSSLLQMEAKFKMSVVGEIPLGLPAPSPPNVRLLSWVLGDALAIAVIVVAVTVSMGSVFAAKHDYSIDVRQEFYALGITECVTSFFPCFPSSTALARSMVYEAAGTKTQLATIFSSLLMLLVIFVLGTFVKPLPVCFLSCIIIVALKSMLMQLSDLSPLWRLSKIDFVILIPFFCIHSPIHLFKCIFLQSIWLFTFLATILCDVIQGLAIGVLFALFMIIFRIQRPGMIKLGRMSHSEGLTYYRALERYRDASFIESVCCVHYDSGALLFVNVTRFKRMLFTLLEPPSQRHLAKSNSAESFVIGSTKLESSLCHSNLEVVLHNQNPNVNHSLHLKTSHKRSASTASSTVKNGGIIRLDVNNADRDDDREKILTLDSFKGPSEIKYIIVDLSSLSTIDLMGANALKDVYQEMKQRDITLFYCATQLSILEFIKRCQFGDRLPFAAVFYPSIQDAVHTINFVLRRNLVEEGGDESDKQITTTQHSAPK
ncbi:unnamed protein product [Anisakis simplex]|uniref:Anion transporter SULP-7d (inferred by orthology to a C. elegans protein) n=1 Tax=Anisakis simplex TaxID=6269 RepID=A0A158PNS5_ANISI|nr:unnamed protein product [Anisakis simplex]